MKGARTQEIMGEVQKQRGERVPVSLVQATGMRNPLAFLRGKLEKPHCAQCSCQEVGALGHQIPAFLSLQSTRSIASRVGLGTWPPSREFGMDFKQRKTQAQS